MYCSKSLLMSWGKPDFSCDQRACGTDNISIIRPHMQVYLENYALLMTTWVGLTIPPITITISYHRRFLNFLCFQNLWNVLISMDTSDCFCVYDSSLIKCRAPGVVGGSTGALNEPL